MNSNYFINNNKTIKDALYSLEKNKQKCLIVLDKNSKFFGTLTDGDVRRAILTNANINNIVKPYVRKKSFTIDEDKFKKLSIIQVEKLINDYSKKKIYLIPILNKKGFVVNFIDKDIKKTELNKVPLIVMAGGKGVRLRPFTDIFPKPLIPVDNIPAA
jgi:predicted transcriptional regulator